MGKRILFLQILISVLFSFSAIAENKDGNVSGKLFSFDGKVYTSKDFPKDYQKLSKKKQEKFLRRFIFYKIFFKSIENERKKYKAQIEENLKKELETAKRKGIRPTELQMMLLTKKNTIDTIAYYETLKKHKDINDEVEKFYKKNKEGYRLPQRVEVSDIVLKDKNESIKLLKQLKDNNDSIELFAKLAQQYSLDAKSRYDGGYVGEIAENGVGKEFFNTVWKSKEKSVVEKPLIYKDYYHLIYLFQKRKEEQRTLKQEREKIIKYLLKDEISDWKYHKYKKVKKATKIEFFDIKL